MPNTLSKLRRQRRTRTILFVVLGLFSLIGSLALSKFEASAADLRPAASGLLAVIALASFFGAYWFSTWQQKRKKGETRFSDIAGAEEAKRNLMEVAAYLKAPHAYEEIGANFPRGIVMHGDPGTGKTLLARALADEAGASFVAMNGSDFGSAFIGVGQAKVKRLFQKARAMAPCVIFIDEIDAIGGQRMDESSAAAREMGATLNQLLVQMDGFASNSGVIVVAATNRLDSLDPALLRSGRFDRRIRIGLPNLKERADILQIHARKVKLDSAVDFNFIARQTIGMSGADLANLVNQAALLAVQHKEERVSPEHLQRARNFLLMGEDNRSTMALMDAQVRQRLAIHECGHAIVAMVGKMDPVTGVSIIPRGMSLGQTFTAPEKETLLLDQRTLLDRINILVGGRVAEEMFTKSVTTGADDDIARATEMALNIVCRHGMSDLGMMRVGDQSSPQLRYIAECRAIDIIDNARSRATAILRANQHVMDRMSLRLVDVEELGAEDVREFKAMVVDPAETVQHVRAA